MQHRMYIQKYFLNFLFYITAMDTCTVEEVVKRTLATTEQVIRLSNATKLQANSALWHAHRRGRITASIAHTVLKCRDQKTAMNQIMKHDATDICVPAVKWGIDNEATARHEYSAYMCQIHDNFKVEEAGLVIDNSFPFIAGSSDGQD